MRDTTGHLSVNGIAGRERMGMDGCRLQYVDAVRGCSTWMQCMDAVHGRSAWMQYMDALGERHNLPGQDHPFPPYGPRRLPQLRGLHRIKRHSGRASQRTLEYTLLPASAAAAVPTSGSGG